MFKKTFFFIVFEGIEGTGKSYQINKLYNSLKKYKLKVEKTREPGGFPTAEKIRKLLFSKSNIKFDSLTDYFLILAARNEHFLKKLLPAKKNKIIVICDRFIDSTLAYQVNGNKISYKLNQNISSYILKNFKPNLTIVLKSDLKTIFRRIKKRKHINKFDKLKKSFYIKAQNFFIKKAKNNKNNYLLFDSSSDDKLLEKKILLKVLNRIK